MNTRICSHRGATTQYHENTVDALLQAKSNGADMIEFDVQRTSDSVWILHHDLFLFDEDQLIKELRYDTIIERAETKGIPIDTLDKFLNEVSGIEMNFECKSERFDDGLELANFMKDYTIFDKHNISSFSASTLKGLHTADKNLRLSYLGYILPWIKWKLLHLQIPLISINPLVRFVNEFKVKTAHWSGLELHTFTANTTDEIIKCFDANVDVIITDHLNKALKLRSDYLDKKTNLSL